MSATHDERTTAGGSEAPRDTGLTGTEPTLSSEVRDEATRLAADPVGEVQRLERVAEHGDSAATPLIVGTQVVLFLGALVAVVCALAFLAYALA